MAHYKSNLACSTPNHGLVIG